MLISRGRFIHKFKRGAPLARVVRRTECTFLAMNDSEALARHAVTCADGQYIGAYGNGFMEEWCKLVASAGRLLAHPFELCASAVALLISPPAAEPELQQATSGVGLARQPSPSAAEPELQQATSGVGSAQQPSPSAGEPESQRATSGVGPAWSTEEETLLVLDASCEFHLLQGVGRFADRKFPAVARFEKLLRDLKVEFGDGASRVFLRGAARLAHKRVRALLAPKVDNFKVTLYSRGFHTRFLYNYDVVYKALAAKYSATYQNEQVLAWSKYEAALREWRARDKSHAAQKEPSPPTRARGLRVKACRELRTLGQSLTDPFLVVFGVGRGDLRDTFLSAYATMTQNFRISGMVKARCRQDLCSAMRAGVHQLGAMVGALRCLHYATKARRWTLGRKGLLLHIKVISAHYGWRYIPNVVKMLPFLLVHQNFDHTIMGMPIKPSTSPFLNPTPKKLSERAAHRLGLRDGERPGYWWERVLDALDQLVRLLRLELIFFEQRLQSWDSGAVAAGSVRDDDAGEGLGSHDQHMRACMSGWACRRLQISHLSRCLGVPLGLGAPLCARRFWPPFLSICRILCRHQALVCFDFHVGNPNVRRILVGSSS